MESLPTSHRADILPVMCINIGVLVSSMQTIPIVPQLCLPDPAGQIFDPHIYDTNQVSSSFPLLDNE